MEILQFVGNLIERVYQDVQYTNTQSLSEWINSAETKSLLREMKSDLKQKEYMNVFCASPQHLATYLAHYIPTRSLCYSRLFSTNTHLQSVLTGKSRVLDCELERRRMRRRCISYAHVEYSLQPDLHITCIGAGAGSELIGLIFAIQSLINASDKTVDLNIEKIPESTFTEFEALLDRRGMLARKITLEMIDIADWGMVQSHISQLALQSQILPNNSVQFKWQQQDILSMPKEELKQKAAQSDLITIMFVLNELFVASKSATVQMLTDLINSMQSGALLLLLESAGSISELSVGQQSFMVYRLLDKVSLLETVDSNDAVWYRYDPTLPNELPLTNMRYFLRIYRRR